MKKKPNKVAKKLTEKDFARMWGEDGPYSQVRVSEEIRILDVSVSRVFKVIEADINPFTFEYVKKHKKIFSNDDAVQQLLQSAEDRGQHGYTVSAGEIKADDPRADDFIRKQKEILVQTVIRMHRYVMEQCGLRYEVRDSDLEGKESVFVWNDAIGSVEDVNDVVILDDGAQVNNSAGTAQNKTRMFVVLFFMHGVPVKQSAMKFIQVLRGAAIELGLVFDNVESFQEHVLIEVLVPFDVVLDDFVQQVIKTTNGKKQKKVFFDAYFVANTHKPSQQEIMNFIGDLKK